MAFIPLCLATLTLLLFTPCTPTRRGEMELEDILLLFRNAVVLSRLVLVLQKNRTQLGNTTKNIDLGNPGLDLMGDIVPGGKLLPAWDAQWDGLEEDFI